jgi:AcrR family transcriptional regulator
LTTDSRGLILRTVLGTPNGDRRSERRASTRDEIVAAAWELCRPNGLAGLSLRDLAKAVGMQAPSLYSYFDSKHAIYDAMYAQAAQAFVDGEAEVRYTGEPLDDLRALTHFFVRFCAEDVERYHLVFQRTIPGFEPSPESFAISERSLAGLQQRFASIGLTDQAAIDLFTALGTGLADQQISNDPGGDRWIRRIDEAMEMLYEHLRRRSSPTRARTKGTGTKQRSRR